MIDNRSGLFQPKFLLQHKSKSGVVFIGITPSNIASLMAFLIPTGRDGSGLKVCIISSPETGGCQFLRWSLLPLQHSDSTISKF